MMRQQQHPRSYSTGAIKREDVAKAAEDQQLRGPRSKSVEVCTSHLKLTDGLFNNWAALGCTRLLYCEDTFFA